MSMQSPLSHVNWKYSNYHCDIIVIVVFVFDIIWLRLLLLQEKNKQTWSLLLSLLLRWFCCYWKKQKTWSLLLLLLLGWFCCYWKKQKNLVIIASGHWKRKDGLLARAVQVVVDCPKMAALENNNFVNIININLRHKKIP